MSMCHLKTWRQSSRVCEAASKTKIGSYNETFNVPLDPWCLRDSGRSSQTHDARAIVGACTVA